MDTVLVQLYYEQLGYSVKKTASLLDKPESYVNQIIAEEGYKQAENLPAVIEPANQVQAIKDQEVSKQAVLAPLYIQAEAILLGKVLDGLQDLDPQRVDAHDVLKSYAGTLQSLKQNAIVNKVFEDKNSGTGIQINVIGMIQ